MSFASFILGVIISYLCANKKKGNKIKDHTNLFRFIIIMFLLWGLDKLNTIISMLSAIE